MYFEKAIAAYYDALFSGDLVALAKISKQIATSNLKVSSGDEIVWNQSHSGDLTFDFGAYGAEVELKGYSWGDVNFEPFSDGSNYESWGIGNQLTIDNSWNSSVSTGFVGGGVFVNDARGVDLNVSWTPTYQVEDSTIDANLGFVENVVLDDVDQSLTEIGTLTEYMTISGNGNNVSIGNAVGAVVQITSVSNDTLLQIERGGTVFDNGDSTSFVGGEGDQFVIANGDGVSMYNGGGYGFLGELLGIQDNDTFVDNGGGVDIISGFETVSLNTEGDVFVFDSKNLEEATLQLGQHDVDIGDLMAVFGEQYGNDAVLNFNGGSVTYVGAADVYFDNGQAPVEDYAFAA